MYGHVARPLPHVDWPRGYICTVLSGLAATFPMCLLVLVSFCVCCFHRLNVHQCELRRLKDAERPA